MTVRISFCSFQALRIMAILPSPIPGISLSRSVLFSMISRVFRPNLPTIRLAMTGPMPLISPEPRYFCTP